MPHIYLKTISVADVLRPDDLIVCLLVGLIAGALAGLVVRGCGFGCVGVGNVIVGIIGSLIAASTVPWNGAATLLRQLVRLIPIAVSSNRIMKECRL